MSATARIVGRQIHQEDIARAWCASAVDSARCILNSFPYTRFAGKYRTCTTDRVKSCFGRHAGAIMVLLGFFPK